MPTPSDQQPVKIVPKGLRSFDAHDADFFLELLPGPRDRDGLPDSIRFWKTRIEETDADNTFSVGLIYGPSGCGKSSLVKAGSAAAAGEVGDRGLRRGDRRGDGSPLAQGPAATGCPDLPGNLGLIESLAALRRGQVPAIGPEGAARPRPVRAMAPRQNGTRRTPNWCKPCGSATAGGCSASSWCGMISGWPSPGSCGNWRFDSSKARTSPLVDLFDLRHARKVLAAFGRAFGRLPDNLGEMHQGPRSLSRSGRRRAGPGRQGHLGAAGPVCRDGEGQAVDPGHAQGSRRHGGRRRHLPRRDLRRLDRPARSIACTRRRPRRVLKALLPESGTDIKGHMRSQQELLEASGYASRPKDFDDLLRILDSEIRLITPTDPEGKDDAELVARCKPGEKYYQLTHDYLVPSLRDWLTRKQKETRRGRAELLLADRAAVWNARPENRQLPSLLQWLQYPLADAEEELDAAAAEDDAQGEPVSCGAGAGAWRAAGRGDVHGPGDPRPGRASSGRQPMPLGWCSAFSMRTRLKCRASSARWPSIDSGPIRCCVKSTTRRQTNSRQKLHASLALLPVDATQVDYLYGRLLDAEPHEVPVIRDALAPHKDELLDKLWAVVEKPDKGKESQRLRAAAALAKYDPDSEKWAKVQDAVWQRSGERTCGVSGRVDGSAASGARASCWLRCPRSIETPNRPRAERSSGDEHSGRLCRRPAAGPGRSAHGRRREAVRRHLIRSSRTMASKACRC